MSEAERLSRLVAWLQESQLVVEYLVCRAIEKRTGAFPEKTPSLFLQLADSDGELTEKLIVDYFDEMAKLAKNGFATSEEFPVFGGID